MLKPKPPLTQANTSSPNLLEGLSFRYLEILSVVEGKVQSQKKEYAKLKLDAGMNSSQLIAQHKLPSQEEQDKSASKQSGALEIFLEKKEIPSSMKSSSSSSVPPQEENANEQLKRFLSVVAEGRRENELIFGKKESDSSQVDNSWGIGAAKTIGCYRKNITRNGWAEFAISYDNKIFLNDTQKRTIGEYSFEFDHQTMGCGTFLKAVGRIKIKDNQLIISPFSPYFEVDFSQLPIILFVLQEKGVAISAQTIAIADESGEIVPLQYYPNCLLCLNGNYYPRAKVIAENKQLSIKKSLDDLFLSIDDKLLSTRNRILIQRLLARSADLKTDIINFLLLLVANNLEEYNDRKQMIEEESNDKPVSEESVSQCYTKINRHILAFQMRFFPGFIIFLHYASSLKLGRKQNSKRKRESQNFLNYER